LATLVVVFGLCGCARPGPSAALPGSAWVLTGLRGAPPIAGTTITLAFEEGRLGGFAGCNGYGAAYTTGRSGMLAVPEIERQLQLCEQPEGVMDQEDGYVAALAQAAAYRITDDQLEIRSRDGTVVLTFARQPVLRADADELAGTSWRLTALDGDAPAPGSTVTINFLPGEVHGLAGCRGYRAAYEAGKGSFHITFLEMLQTEASCPEPLMAQEGRYTTMLGWVRGYRLVDDQLELHTSRGEVLAFEPLAEDAG
jgi:heat shock protein HslJ